MLLTCLPVVSEEWYCLRKTGKKSQLKRFSVELMLNVTLGRVGEGSMQLLCSACVVRKYVFSSNCITQEGEFISCCQDHN